MGFYTLYTTIPHPDFTKCIEWLLVKMFRQNAGKKYIGTPRKVFFCQIMRSGQYRFDEAEFVDVFEFCIDCVPRMATFYLFYNLFNTLNSYKEKTHHNRVFNLTGRFIDDILSVSNKYFQRYVSLIYQILERTETTECDIKCNFLDLLLVSDYGELKCQVNYRRNDFTFDIVNYPFMDSKI